mgnify:CR=1 FL=1
MQAPGHACMHAVLNSSTMWILIHKYYTQSSSSISKDLPYKQHQQCSPCIAGHYSCSTQERTGRQRRRTRRLARVQTAGNGLLPPTAAVVPASFQRHSLARLARCPVTSYCGLYEASSALLFSGGSSGRSFRAAESRWRHLRGQQRWCSPRETRRKQLSSLGRVRPGRPSRCHGDSSPQPAAGP